MKICTLAWAMVAGLAAPLVAAQPLDPAAEQSTQSVDPAPLDTAAEAAADDRFFRFHLAGYADATYLNTQGDGSVGEFTLAPIFHVQLADRVLIEAELELEADTRGATGGAWEYAAVNWLLNDNLALVVGRFLSPVGYFAPNQHPSWINKMASLPAGFGHAGAAPSIDFGVQLRGGKAFNGGQSINYAVYLGNGPQLGLEGMDGLNLGNEGAITNPDGKRVAGGRLGWMPIPTLELGVSLARGGVRLDPAPVSDLPEPARNYRVDGFDVAWRPAKALDLRAEWIRQRVGAASGSLVPEPGTWRAWYVQGAYRFAADKWEAVLRYGDSMSPHAESTFKQTAIGINYLLRPNAKIKLTQEFNNSVDAEAGANRLLLQFAYGF